MNKISFEWDTKKNTENIKKHNVTFELAKEAFFDEKRLIAIDLDHSTEKEKLYYCIGKVGNGILTVRFTYRDNKIRIFGAGYWRKGKKAYENQ